MSDIFASLPTEHVVYLQQWHEYDDYGYDSFSVSLHYSLQVLRAYVAFVQKNCQQLQLSYSQPSRLYQQPLKVALLNYQLYDQLIASEFKSIQLDDSLQHLVSTQQLKVL